MSAKKQWIDWHREKVKYVEARKPTDTVLNAIAQRLLTKIDQGENDIIIEKTSPLANVAQEIATYWMPQLNEALHRLFLEDYEEGPVRSIPSVTAIFRWDDIVFIIQ